MNDKHPYKIKRTTTPLPSHLKGHTAISNKKSLNPGKLNTTYERPASEDDDGYDPYSDKPAPREPLFEKDPWN